MNKKLIIISGYSGSGKTTLVNEIYKNYNCEIIRFGDVHKKSVKNSGYIYAKDWIKEEGIEPYSNKLLLCFKDELISKINNDVDFIIIDGIFSDKCLYYIKNINSINVTNIVLDAKYETRIQRMSDRENMDYQSTIKHMYTTDHIKEQAGLSNIIKKYDYIIDANVSKEYTKCKCIEIMKKIKCIDNNNELDRY